MNVSRSLRVAALGAIATFGIPSLANAGLVITEVMSSSAHGGGTNNADWYELHNTGPLAVNLSTYTWNDNNGTPIGVTPPPGPATFGAIASIAAGETIVINEETLGAEASFRSDWSIPGGIQVVNLAAGVVPGFGSGGDSIVIYDGSNAVAASVTFGAATMGFTFEWDTNGNPMGLSVAGQNGAYVATSNGQTVGLGPGIDVGSPGVVVPEPSALAGIGLAMSLLARRRRLNV